MSKRDRGNDSAIVALAVTLFLVIFSLIGFYQGIEVGQTRSAQVNAEKHHDDATDYIESTCMGLDTVALRVCIQEAVETSGEYQRAEYDLAAQQNMSEWAKWLLILTMLGTTVTVIGVVFVWKTLLATQAAVAATQESSRDANRAYVDVDAVMFFWGSQAGQSPEIKISLRNSGATPAKWYQIRQNYMIYDHAVSEPFGDTFSSLPLHPRFSKRWNGIPPKESGMRTAGPVVRDVSEVRKCWRPPLEIGVTPKDNTHGIAVFGEVRYCTAFDEIYVSQFFYGLPSLDLFESKTPEVIDSQVVAGRTQTIRRVEEIPQTMMKFPINLDLYKAEEDDE